MNRQNCWSNSPEGKHTEECFIEELAEKKCLAARLCPAQFKTFYQYTECHLWAESFAHTNDPSYTEARERINKDHALKNMCRGIVLDLSKEMSKVGAKLILEALKLIEENKAKFTSQNESRFFVQYNIFFFFSLAVDHEGPAVHACVGSKISWFRNRRKNLLN